MVVRLRNGGRHHAVNACCRRCNTHSFPKIAMWLRNAGSEGKRGQCVGGTRWKKEKEKEKERFDNVSRVRWLARVVWA